MKKATKVTIIIALILFIVGIGLTVYGFYKNDWRTDNLTMKFEKKTFVSEELFDKIDADLVNGSVIIEKADTFSVEYNESDKYPMSIGISEGVLKISSDKKKWFWLFNWCEIVVTIRVPYQLQDMNILTHNGKIAIKGFDMNKENGLGDINLATSNGKIDLSSLSAKNITADTSNGNITVNSITADTIDLKTSNGKINAESSRSKILNLLTSNGRINLNEIDSDKIDAKTSNGVIEGTVKATDLRAKTSNGNIRLTVRGVKDEYNIRLIGTQQNENIAVPDSANKIYCETNNGKCSVSFIE